MTRNIVQMHNEIDSRIDFTNNPRFSSMQYDKAINEAIEQIVNDRYDNVKRKKTYSLESIQRVKDELYTLVTVSSPITPVADVVSLPNNYKHYMMLTSIVNGVSRSTKPVSYDQLQDVLDNTFLAPDEENPIFVENSSGFRIYYGTGNTLGTVELTYIKHPDTVSRAFPRNVISSGTGVLTPASDYIVIKDETVHNSVTYYKGEIFTAANADLGAGEVILRSLTTDCNLPSTLHKEVIDIAASIMEGWVDETGSKQSLEFDAGKS